MAAENERLVLYLLAGLFALNMIIEFIKSLL